MTTPKHPWPQQAKRQHRLAIWKKTTALCALSLTLAVTISAAAPLSTTVSPEPAIELVSIQSLSELGQQIPLEHLSQWHTVTVLWDETTTTVSACDETVSQLLDRLGIQVGQYDDVSLPLDQKIDDDETITVRRATLSYETLWTELPYETQRVADDTMPEGEEVLTQAGVTGLSYEYYQTAVTPDGVMYRTLLRSGVKTAPTDEIITYGTYVEPVVETTPSAAPTVNTDSNTITTASGETLSYSKVLTCTATAYTASAGAKTATGTTPRVGAIAVDPSVIAYGTRMYIVSADGSIVYGYATAEDCGGAIKGNKVDLYYDTYDACIQFGRRDVTVYILD